MTIGQQSRRDILKATAALTATAAVGAVVRRAAAQGGAAQSRQIDAVLRRATDTKEVPGVVAVAANDKGVIYEGAFGTRDLAKGPAMTLDTIFRLASMTKAVTSVAAMQLVEQGRLQLDQPVGNILPELSAPQVLQGFDDAGAPRLRPAKRPITLRHLLTHTAGFAYDVWDPELARYIKASGTPPGSTGKLASLRLPLVFDPGERWEYGINLDWAGRTVEAVSGLPLEVYFRQHIFAPLGMADTDYVISAAQRSRLVRRASAQRRRVARAERAKGPAMARVLERRRRSLFDRAGLSGVPADADASRALQRRPAAATADRRVDGTEPDRRHPSGRC